MNKIISKEDQEKLVLSLQGTASVIKQAGNLNETEALSIHLANLGTLTTIVYTYSHLLLKEKRDKA